MTYTHLVTLTYRNSADFRSDHVGAWTRAYREWCDANDVVSACLWVAEQDRSGTTHFHVAIFLPQGALVPLSEMNHWWTRGYFQVLKCPDAFQRVCGSVCAGVDL